VDLAHKKRKVARDMLHHFLVSSRERGSLFAQLYPFRPDFYHRMGVGWSSRIHDYAVNPLQLPAAPQCAPARYVNEDDLDALQVCYMQNFERLHGMVGTNGWEWKRFLHPGSIAVGVKEGDAFSGYMSFIFRNVEGENNYKDMHVNHIVWNTPDAMHSLLHFIRLQADQVRHVHMPLIDDTFCYLLPDPRHTELRTITPTYHQCSRAGIGMMVRVLDTAAAILARPWGMVSATVRFEVEDDFIEGNGSPVTVRFQNGVPHVVQNDVPDFTLATHIQNFSPLLLNAVTLPALHDLGLVWLPQGGLAELTTLFRRDEKPVCVAKF
jgi:predicted acetyltransferase